MNFFINIFSRLILTISILLLIYIIYKSEIYWDGKKRSFYFIYYILSSVFIFISILTFFIKKKTIEYLIISSVSILTSLYLFEAYLVFNPQQLKEQISKEKIYEKQTKKKWDKRSKFKIYDDLKKINNQIVVTVEPEDFLNENYSIFPLSGISKSETIFCNISLV